MGLLIDGQWQDKWYDTKSSDGKFVREASKLRSWVTSDGSAGETGSSGYKAEANRYHLYVSYACPWAHRTLIFRCLKGLKDLISFSVVSPEMLEHGWAFDPASGSTGDHLFNEDYLHRIYTRNQKDYTGRVTVPVLWDKKQQCIVNNESADIIRMFNSAFNDVTGDQQNFYPAELRDQIDSINKVVYEKINNGVYLCGFATDQSAYEQAYEALFDALDQVEGILAQNRYLVGDCVTEADWRLFTTLIRFDSVYHGHFKCNRQRLEDFEHISGYVRELYQWPGIANTVNFEHIKRHYYYSHTMINPTQIVPVGPKVDYLRAHRRDG